SIGWPGSWRQPRRLMCSRGNLLPAILYLQHRLVRERAAPHFQQRHRPRKSPQSDVNVDRWMPASTATIFGRLADRDPQQRPGIWECRLIAVGRVDLDDELRIRSVNGPRRSGNQVQVVIYPKRVKPYESFGPLLL